MSALEEYITVSEAKSIEDVYQWIDQKDDWIFRGQADSRWDLTTTLERALQANPEGLAEGGELERGLVRRFQREAHHHLDHLPDDDNIPEWLGIMQHYGAPTRLLDWTHSFDIGLFFALIDQRGPSSALWALNWRWVDDQLPSSVKEVYSYDRNCLSRESFGVLTLSGPAIAKLNSYRISVRQSVQQATFIIPLNISQTFESNLLQSLTANPAEKPLRKLLLPISLRAKLIQRQYRQNIHHHVLFPGIDGFAKSLNSMILMPYLLHPGDPWKNKG